MTASKKYQPLVSRRVREVALRGVNYSVSEWGDPDAPLAFYLHGWGDTGSTFQFVVDALQSDWHVVAPDWRGFGSSSIDCTSYWFPDYLADLHALLLIYSPTEPVRLIGHSMGANVASLYAGTMPERVRALVNIEGFGLADSDPAEAPRRYRQWIESQDDPQHFSEYPDLESLAYRIRKRSPNMSGAAAIFVAGEWAGEDVDGTVLLHADPLHKLPNPVLYRRAEAEACWRAITADSLLVTGTESRLVEKLGGATALLPGTEHVALEKAGHMPHFEAPSSLAQAIERFLLQTL